MKIDRFGYKVLRANYRNTRNAYYPSWRRRQMIRMMLGWLVAFAITSATVGLCLFLIAIGYWG